MTTETHRQAQDGKITNKSVPSQPTDQIVISPFALQVPSRRSCSTPYYCSSFLSPSICSLSCPLAHTMPLSQPFVAAFNVPALPARRARTPLAAYRTPLCRGQVPIAQSRRRFLRDVACLGVSSVGLLPLLPSPSRAGEKLTALEQDVVPVVMCRTIMTPVRRYIKEGSWDKARISIPLTASALSPQTLLTPLSPFVLFLDPSPFVIPHVIGAHKCQLLQSGVGIAPSDERGGRATGGR